MPPVGLPPKVHLNWMCTCNGTPRVHSTRVTACKRECALSCSCTEDAQNEFWLCWIGFSGNKRTKMFFTIVWPWSLYSSALQPFYLYGSTLINSVFRRGTPRPTSWRRKPTFRKLWNGSYCDVTYRNLSYSLCI